MYFVGKLNREIFRCISEDIHTDEVIITENQVNHIIERRGEEFYIKYFSIFKTIIEEPDYIFRDNENTALVCKRIEEDGKVINLVVRLVLPMDEPEYKNSIITAIYESEKRFQQRLRNNVALYKRE
ncbi:MAG: hypothetical protein IJ420_03800 [Lachnospiraceae bacterium]|nr:hypothetical protein [Lachnospiraceae bacterium]MBQ8632707.1 hypothetical protein [Lachnospiraceae bacterium]